MNPFEYDDYEANHEALKRQQDLDDYRRLLDYVSQRPTRLVNRITPLAPETPLRRESDEPLIPTEGAAYLAHWFSLEVPNVK